MKKITSLVLFFAVSSFPFNGTSLIQAAPTKASIKRSIDLNTLETQELQIPFSFSLGSVDFSK